jgi:hypothetical protein
LYEIGIVLSAIVAVALATLSMLGVIDQNQVEVFFLVLAFCYTGFSNLLARVNVMPDD